VANVKSGVPDSSRLVDLLPSLSTGRVLVVGDLMLDRYVTGTVERVSPEAPIPVMRVDDEDEMLGGAGNVARNIASLGGQVILVGLIGDDLAGGCLAELLTGHDGIEFRPVVGRQTPTTVKTRYLATGQQLLRTDIETKVPPQKETLAQIVVDAQP
jgi:D-beta-D-heptose 7-phosphate kinase/D-beta-D-heptose 1-phosphate adenosyltransferase